MERKIPQDLLQCWEDATSHQSPLAALRATKEFWPRWAQWQAMLAREAITNGATWDEIGRAMGTSRQAAWGRFKSVVERGEQMEQARKQQIRQTIKELQARARERDQALASERRRLRDELRALDKKRAQERSALQQEIRRLQADFRRTRQQADAK
jgi:hypothetical protein